MQPVPSARSGTHSGTLRDLHRRPEVIIGFTRVVSFAVLSSAAQRATAPLKPPQTACTAPSSVAMARPDGRDLVVAPHPLGDFLGDGLEATVSRSRPGHPAVEYSPRRRQPLSVAAHGNDFDHAARRQQRGPQPGMLPAPGPQGALRRSLQLDEHERRTLGVERQREPVDEGPAAGAVRPGMHAGRPHFSRHPRGRQRRRLLVVGRQPRRVEVLVTQSSASSRRNATADVASRRGRRRCTPSSRYGARSTIRHNFRPDAFQRSSTAALPHRRTKRRASSGREWPGKARYCGRRKTPPCRHISASHAASRPVQPGAPSEGRRAPRLRISAAALSGLRSQRSASIPLRERPRRAVSAASCLPSGAAGSNAAGPAPGPLPAVSSRSAAGCPWPSATDPLACPASRPPSSAHAPPARTADEGPPDRARRPSSSEGSPSPAPPSSPRP